MGSRVSVVERRLDETRSALDGVEHLRAKATAQTLEIKELYRKIAELSALVGVEDRVKGLVEDSQVFRAPLDRGRNYCVITPS